MFTFFRYGLAPVVLFCCVVVAASVDVHVTNSVRKSTWPQTAATVMQAQDWGKEFAEFRGIPNTFPDPRGTLRYVVDGETYTWQGRGRDIGVTAMTPGATFKVHYNPKNPHDINTLVLLGAGTGNVILAVALAFLAFYVWFFWLRGLLRRSGPGDFGGDRAGTFSGGVPEPLASQPEWPRAATIGSRPVGKFFDSGSRTTFGKR